MRVVPVPSKKSQTLTVPLSGQSARLNIYQLSTGMFMDVLVNDVAIISGVICRNNVRIVQSRYLGFIGDLVWLDMQGGDDPNWTALGTRFILVYLEAADL